MKLVVTIPAFNEEETIANVIADVPREIEGVESVEVLVMDDGSTDDTVKQAREAGADKILSHRENIGLGVAFKDGLEVACEMGADLIVNIDGDGQYNAKEISELIRPILKDKCDIVLGWRDIDNLDFMPWGKRIGNKVATWLTRRLCGLPIRDAQSGFRAFSREAALRLNLAGSYTYVQETLMQARYKGLKIEQIPIGFRPRQGESRLISSLPSYARRAGAIILSTYWNYHPLRVFSFIGGLLFLIGLAFGIRVLVHFFQTGAVSPHIPSAIVASLLIIAGLQAVLLGLFAHMLRNQRLFQEETLYRLKKKESSK